MKMEVSLSVVAVLGLLSSSAVAGPASIPDNSKDKEIPVTQEEVCDPRWYISIGGGGAFDVGNSHSINGFTDNYESLGNGGNFTFPAGTTLDIRTRDWDDTHDTAWRAQGEIGYALTEHLEVFGRFNYEHSDSSGFTDVGTLSVDLLGGVSVIPLRAELDNYNAEGGELGFRFFLQPRQARFRPYVAFSGGVTHVDGMDATITSDASSLGGPTDFLFYHGGFFDESWVGTGAAMLGLEVKLSCHWDVGVEGGARYQSRLEQNNSGFTGGRFFDGAFATPLTPLRPINDDAGDRWTVPVTGYVKFRF